MSNLKKDDLIINISKSGLSKSILQMSDIAKRNHVKQVCISSDVDSCLSENAEFTIFSGRLFNDINDSHNGLETHIGEYIVNDVIIALIISIKMNNNEFIKSQELEYEFFSSLKI
ncbi:D-arabinose 5-phosphate isomerase [Chlamydia trachomatis]|nr:D-arabinose 5-phosphate isomerase [Chlamydia trachomatis]